MGILSIKEKAAQQNQAAELQSFKQSLRRQLIAERGSTYTYRNPKDLSGRARAEVGEDGKLVYTDAPTVAGE